MNYLWLTGAIASVSAFWGQLRMALDRFASLFIVRASFELDSGQIVSCYLFHKYRCFRSGSRIFQSYEDFIRPANRFMRYGFELPYANLIFYRNREILFISNNHGTSDSINAKGGINITAIRGTVDLEQLFQEAIDFWNQDQEKSKVSFLNSRYEITKVTGKRHANINDQSDSDGKAIPSSSTPAVKDYCKIIKWKKEDIGSPIVDGPFNGLAYDDKVQELKDEISRWLKSKEWFRERHLPWRMGISLYGPPGTGKSSFVRAIGQELDLPIFSLDLSTMTNNELSMAFNRAKNRSPCIVLLEDLDRIFDKDKNIISGNEANSLTLNALLNCISGVDNSDGILTFITANNVDRIDEAIGMPDATGKSSRPGRIDRAMEFGIMNKENRIKLAKVSVRAYPELIPFAVQNGDGETGAQFSYRCQKLALDKYWGRTVENKEDFEEAEVDFNV